MLSFNAFNRSSLLVTLLLSLICIRELSISPGALHFLSARFLRRFGGQMENDKSYKVKCRRDFWKLMSGKEKEIIIFIFWWRLVSCIFRFG